MNSNLRLWILGFVAGLLALLTLVAVVYLALAVAAAAFTLVDELARARAAGTPLVEPIWALLGQSLVVSSWNALHGLWDLRGAFVVFGTLGVLAAWSYQAGRLVDPAHAWRISFLTVAALIVVAAITWVYLQREQIALWMAESPETYRWREIMFGSQIAALTVAPIFAVTIAYPAWAAWRWWFTRLDGRPAGDGVAAATPEVARGPAADHRSYATRLAALKRGAPAEPDGGPQPGGGSMPAREAARQVGSVHSNRLLVSLVLLSAVCFAGYLIADRSYAQVALRLQHGTAFVDVTTQPRQEFPLRIAPDVHRLRIVNVNGLGAVSLTLSPAANPDQVIATAPDWAFQWRADDYLYQDIAVQGLVPGDYVLRFEQCTGWGYFEYMLSQGGGRASQFLAMATGLLLATALLLACAAIALVVTRVWAGASVLSAGTTTGLHLL